jgi:pyruvate-ferredoxin/flavodoxin oxidoreductase
VKVCNDNALKPVTQTPASTEKLRRNWDLWQNLPTTAPEFIRIDSLDEGIGALHTLLLGRNRSDPIRAPSVARAF